jgi:excisionase family DNA binding protein
MEPEPDLQKLLRKFLEPKIDDCITRAFNKNINEFKFEKKVDNEEVFDIEGATTYLSISKGTMYRLTMGREIPHYKVGKRLYFKKEDLNTWIGRGKVLTNQEIHEEADRYLLGRKR